jgi:hypothetical protein
MQDMKRISPALIGTSLGAIAGHFLGPYHGGALLFACAGFVLGWLVERGLIRVY